MTDLDVQRICLECGQRIVGRTDKKFCNDHCRTAWHNKLHSDSTSYMRNVNNILRKNRRILAALVANGRKKVDAEALMRLGFEFGYFTNMKKRRNGPAMLYCYEQSYVMLPKGVCILIPKITS
jgi:hypothetical protein